MNASAVFPLSNVEPRSVELPLMAGTAVPRRVKEAAVPAAGSASSGISIDRFTEFCGRRRAR